MVGEVALLLVEEGQLALEPVEGCRAGGRRGRGGCLLLLLRGQKNLPFINYRNALLISGLNFSP